MIRILLHPYPEPGDSVLLSEPWHWWRFRLHPDANGNWFTQCVDDPRDVREASILFAGGDVELVDPPALHLITTGPEYQDIYSARGPGRVLLTRGQRVECDVVWSRCPGPGWELLPGNVCEPGDYRIETVGRSERRDSDRFIYDRTMPLLRWAPQSRFDAARELNREEIAAIYQVPAAIVAPAPWLDDYLRAAWESIAEYRSRNYANPVAILIHPQDYRRLLTLPDQRPLYLPGDGPVTFLGLELRTDPNMAPGQIVLIGPQSQPVYRDEAPQQYPVAFVMLHTGDPGPEGTDNQASERLRAVFTSDGRMVGSLIWSVRAGAYSHISLWDGARTAQDGGDYFVLSGPLSGGPVMLSSGGQVMVGDIAMPPEVAAILPTTYATTTSYATSTSWRRLGLSSYEVSDFGGVRSIIPRRSPNVLNPEDNVLDAIDQLVNEQVRLGPRDDYSVNRYPKCRQCGHQWHGLECDKCDCVNTDWLKTGRHLDLDGGAPPASPRRQAGRQLDL